LALRGLAGLLGVVVALGATGAAWQAAAAARDARRFPPRGELVDVGGYRLHLDVAGAAEPGEPTVILDAGSGSMAAQWGWVRDDLAGSTRVVAYDRPGTGYSDAPPAPLDAAGLAADLGEALDLAGVEGPYVVVGHSMGALTARAFAVAHPGQVAGMVLVDPRVSRLQDDWPEVGALPAGTPLLLRLAPFAARLGVLRVLDPRGDNVDQLPAPDAGRARAALAAPGHWAGVFPDARLGESAAELLTADGADLAGLPLVVLSATEPDTSIGDAADRAWFTGLHERLATAASTSGEHRLVDGADHMSIVTDPRHAAAVTDAIREVVQAGAAGPARTAR
jgi:pimeloyl-ACP methyl ester carboxylesterase